MRKMHKTYTIQAWLRLSKINRMVELKHNIHLIRGRVDYVLCDIHINKLYGIKSIDLTGQKKHIIDKINREILMR